MPKIVTGYSYSMRNALDLSLRIGYKKLYVVRNLTELVQHFEQRDRVAYGKNLDVVHDPALLDETSRELLALITEHIHTVQNVDRVYHSYDATSSMKEGIRLSGDTLDRFFDLYLNREVEMGSRETTMVLLKEEDPRLRMSVALKGQAVELRFTERIPNVLGENKGTLYVEQNHTIYRCSKGYSRDMWDFMHAASQNMTMAPEDLPAFCSCVLPIIGRYVTIEDKQGLMTGYQPDSCTPCFYFDKPGENTLRSRLTFRYGDHELRPDSGPVAGIRRNARTEAQAAKALQRYLHVFVGQDGINQTFVTS